MSRWKAAMERAHKKEGKVTKYTWGDIVHGRKDLNKLFNLHNTEWYKADEVDADKRVPMDNIRDKGAKEPQGYHKITMSLDQWKVSQAHIQELVEENEKLDVECTKRQLEIYQLREALEEIRELSGQPFAGVIARDIATEALKDRQG